MNVFGIDILQLIIYACVAASFVVVVYILKLARAKTKTRIRIKSEPESTLESPDKTIKQLIALIDKMWSRQAGLNPNSNTCSTSSLQPAPTKRRTRKKPESPQSHSIQKIDEETYTPTEQDKKVLERIRSQIGEK